MLAYGIIASQTAHVVVSDGFLALPEQTLRLILGRDDLSIEENDVYHAARKSVKK